MATRRPNLAITIQTGGDELRGDSSATAYVLVVKGTEIKEYVADQLREPDYLTAMQAVQQAAVE